MLFKRRKTSAWSILSFIRRSHLVSALIRNLLADAIIVCTYKGIPTKALRRSSSLSTRVRILTAENTTMLASPFRAVEDFPMILTVHKSQASWSEWWQSSNTAPHVDMGIRQRTDEEADGRTDGCAFEWKSLSFSNSGCLSTKTETSLHELRTCQSLEWLTWK